MQDKYLKKPPHQRSPPPSRARPNSVRLGGCSASQGVHPRRDCGNIVCKIPIHVAGSGLKQYVSEVQPRTFPDDDHNYTVDKKEHEKLLSLVEKRKHH